MSLISDALKKAQEDRDKIQPEEARPLEPEEPGIDIDPDSRRNKRIWFYGIFTVVVAAVTVTLIIISNQGHDTVMKALNVSQPPAARPPVFSSPKIEEKKKEKEEPVVKPPVYAEPKEKPKIEKPKIEKLKIQKVKEKEAPKAAAPVSTPDDLIREGDRLAADQAYTEAAVAYKSALQIKKTPDLYRKIYAMYSAMNNSVLARAYIDDGLKYFPDDFNLNKSSAVIYIRAKAFPKAMENAKKALEQNPNDHNLLTYMGLCYFHTTKDYAAALGYFQKSLDQDSDAVENYYYIGLIYDNKAEYQKALEFYNAFIKLNRDDKNFKHKEWINQRIKALQEYLNPN
jgi:thioredoxin-like negative regulator of GroEL